MTSKYWSPVVSRLSPYTPGEQPKQKVIKLNTNESPYGPSPKALQAMRDACGDALRLYPSFTADRVRRVVSVNLGVAMDQVFVGNGSDEVLAHAFNAFFQQSRPLLFPDISYSFYPTYCGLYGIAFQSVPVTEDFRIEPDDYLPGGPHGPAGGIILPTPNAPTGRALSLAEIERIVAGNPQCAVVIDEAYVDFGAESAVPLTSKYDNLLVVQTLSKSRALAGLRVGFAVGSPELIEGLNRVKDSFNSYPVDSLAEIGAAAAIEDVEHFEKTRLAVMKTRDELDASLRKLGFEAPRSLTNFIFARHPGHDAVKLAAGLRERGILVRHFRLPRIDQYLRISIGTDDECALLVDALSELIA
ncbi:MAG: pyridoxal phosphate-dependent aminotransferase [Bordetella sp.]|uniref:pyridoxal phosphate-dependent aminotransferase n=1 Tax=Bordetella sp. TaxID=28081 RepID=UPI003F7CC457